MKKWSFFFRPGKKTPLVYIHGLGCDKNDFRQALREPGLRGHTILSIDLPGCGDSPYSTNRHLTIDDLAEIVFQLIKQKITQPVILIAHSMGSMIALSLAKKHPRSIAAMIHLDGTLVVTPKLSTNKALKQTCAEFSKNVLQEHIERFRLSKNIGQRTYAKQLSKVDAQAYYDYSRSMVVTAKNKRLLKQYLASNIPMIYVCGANDEKEHSCLNILREHKKQIMLIPHSGHFPMHEQSKKFYDLLVKLVSSPIVESRTLFFR